MHMIGNTRDALDMEFRRLFELTTGEENRLVRHAAEQSTTVGMVGGSAANLLGKNILDYCETKLNAAYSYSVDLLASTPAEQDLSDFPSLIDRDTKRFAASIAEFYLRKVVKVADPEFIRVVFQSVQKKGFDEFISRLNLKLHQRKSTMGNHTVNNHISVEGNNYGAVQAGHTNTQHVSIDFGKVLRDLDASTETPEKKEEVRSTIKKLADNKLFNTLIGATLGASLKALVGS